MNRHVKSKEILIKTQDNVLTTQLDMEKHFVGRKKRQNGKEIGTEMKDGNKWENMEVIWQFKYRKLS